MPRFQGERNSSALDFGLAQHRILQRKAAFSRRWRDTRTQQLLREDIHDLTLVREVSQIGQLAERLPGFSGDSIVMSYEAFPRVQAIPAHFNG